MAKLSMGDLTKIQKLVGNINESNLKYVDCYIAENFGLFIPSVGFCEYAIMPRHTHPAYSFVLFFSANQTIRPITIQVPPDCYSATAMGPDVPHEEPADDSFTRYIAIFISKELFEGAYSNYSQKPPEQYCWDEFVVGHEIMIYLKKFMSEAESRLPGCENLSEALAVTITHQIIRSLLKINNEIDFITKKFEIEQTVEFMYQHFGEKLTISGLAKIAKMSESHFIRTFKKETGFSPLEFLIGVRIDKAKKLLRSGTKNITEVSLQCGFSSASHFSASFTKQSGLTPSEYLNSFSQ